MTVATNAFEPRALARMLEIRKRPVYWYRDTYYGGAPEQHGSPLVEMHVLIHGQRMAPIQRPTDRSQMMSRDAATAGIIRLPYMKPGRPTNAEELIRQLEAGSHLYTPQNLVERAQRRIGADIMELDDMIDLRVEYMAAKGVQTGVTPLVSLDGDGNKMGVDAEVTWGMPAGHLITLTGAALWTASTSDPVGNTRTWGALIAASAGLSATVATLGRDAAAAFLKHADIRSLLDNRRIEAGQLQLREMQVEGINYLGQIAGVDFYEDLRTYPADQTGTATPFTPVDRLVLGSRRSANRMEYGPISDLKCTQPLVARWTKTWEQDEPSQRYVAVHSRPLPCNRQPDAQVSVKVV